MGYLETIQMSIDYIEANLTERISLLEVARRSYFSLYYFHHIFSALVGDSVKEYIRKRRLSCAGYDLVNSDTKIIELALKYQYETQESFTRAFIRVYGIPPGKYRKQKKHACQFSKVNLMSKIIEKNKGVNLMEHIEPKIIIKNEFKVIGYELRTTSVNEEHCIEIPEFCNMCFSQDFEKRIQNKVNPGKILGISTKFSDNGDFSYIVCTEVSSLDLIPEGMMGETFPAATYALFTTKGAKKSLVQEKIGEAWDYFYGTWLPNSQYYQPEDNTNFEVYDERFTDENYELDIYLPMKEKVN